MPRYFFHIRDHAEIRDNIGVELLGPDQVKQEVKRIADFARALLPNKPFRIVVADEDNQTVCDLQIGA